ncbi:peptidoglycan D,D-transpeptidase FtsI family protein [Cellulomonas soli]|uniref:peptidoglycan D,D-transpeptidase FtsI family protein n=1 Tax=Cellulomonas soli TaxID=931535 RepID=UPI003F8609F9
MVFGGRLVWVQGIHGSEVAALALEARLTPQIESIGTRGQITDTNGTALAVSVERYVVSVNQQVVEDYQGTNGTSDGAVGVAERLAPLLDMDPATLGAALVGDRKYKVIAKDVLPAVAREIRAEGLPGVGVDKKAERVYPNGDLAGNIIGFVNSNGVGLAGLEQALDGQLQGTAGSSVYERGLRGQPIPGGYNESTDAVPGDSVQLTLNADIQWKAQEAIDAQVAATGADSGAIVVMDTVTGEIYALADSGSLDPNNPGDSTGSVTPSVSDVFEPGSTGKVITMAAALETGLVTPLTPFEVPYQYTSNGQTFKDSHEHGLLKLTTTGILAESSNTGTLMIGEQLSLAQRYDYLSRFGFGSRTGIELPAESAGLLRDGDEWDSWDKRSQLSVLFGQSVSVTALQATSVFATIANNGVRAQPHLVKGWTSADGTYTPATVAAGTQVVSEQTADTVLSMLESVVDDGTGGKASIPGYRVAGKTGTAQNWTKPVGVTASFIGVAPADSPRIAVSVVLKNPRTSEFGGVVAAPVFSDVTAYALAELGVAPSGSQPTLFPTTWE